MPGRFQAATLPAAADHMSDQAAGQLAELQLDFATFGAGAQALDHADQAGTHVPDQIPPPATLPEAALGQASELAEDHLADLTFDFSSLALGAGRGGEPLDHVATQAESHAPAEIPPPVTLPDAAISHVEAALSQPEGVARSHIPDHDWLV